MSSQREINDSCPKDGQKTHDFKYLKLCVVFSRKEMKKQNLTLLNFGFIGISASSLHRTTRKSSWRNVLEKPPANEELCDPGFSFTIMNVSILKTPF